MDIVADVDGNYELSEERHRLYEEHFEQFEMHHQQHEQLRREFRQKLEYCQRKRPTKEALQLLDKLLERMHLHFDQMRWHCAELNHLFQVDFPLQAAEAKFGSLQEATDASELQQRIAGLTVQQHTDDT